jgi:hypothetical protein
MEMQIRMGGKTYRHTQSGIVFLALVKAVAGGKLISFFLTSNSLKIEMDSNLNIIVT